MVAISQEVVSHTHRDSRVGDGRSARLNSCCRACDLVADGRAEYGDFPFLGYVPNPKMLLSQYVLQERAAKRIASTVRGTPAGSWETRSR